MTSQPQGPDSVEAGRSERGDDASSDAEGPPAVDSVEVVESNQPLDEWGED